MATATFVEQGYGGASMNEIARRAGASKNSLYRLFPSKAALFTAMMTRRLGPITEQLDELDERYGSDPPELLRQVAVGALTHVLSEDEAQLRRVVIQVARMGEFRALSEALRSRRDHFRRWLATYLEGTEARQKLTIGDGIEAVDVFLSLVIGEVEVMADMNLFKPSSAWIDQRAHDRVELFMRIYQRQSSSRTAHPSRR